LYIPLYGKCLKTAFKRHLKHPVSHTIPLAYHAALNPTSVDHLWPIIVAQPHPASPERGAKLLNDEENISMMAIQGI